MTKLQMFHVWAFCHMTDINTQSYSVRTDLSTSSSTLATAVVMSRAMTWCWRHERMPGNKFSSFLYASVSQPLRDRGLVNYFLIRRGPGAQHIYFSISFQFFLSSYIKLAYVLITCIKMYENSRSFMWILSCLTIRGLVTDVCYTYVI
jgi:hypothetical protein